MRVLFSCLSLLAWIASAGTAQAQDIESQRALAVTLSAGLALTTGNTDTSTLNAAYEVTYTPVSSNVVKSDGLFLRGETEGISSANRIGFSIRNEINVTPRLYVFAQNQYLRDEFKDIDYLLAPTIGVGVKLFDSERTKLAIDASGGGVWEKNTDFTRASSGAVTFSERLSQTLTETTALTHSLSALWRTNDLRDALYTASISVAAAISTHTQLKIEALNTLKNKPPLPTVQKNDLTILMAIVYKS